MGTHVQAAGSRFDKIYKGHTLLTLWKKNGQVCFVSTAADQAEKTRRSQIRRGQRERRAARLKSSKYSLPGM